MTKNLKIKIFLYSLFAILFSASLISCFSTTDFKIDHFSFKTVNYIKENYKSPNFNNSILSVKTDKDNIDSLHSMYVDFHYDKYVDDCRIINNDSQEIVSFDGADISCEMSFIYQNFLSSYQTSDSGNYFVLDYSKYYVYFNKNTQVGDSNMMVLVSDDFADNLLKTIYLYENIDELNFEDKKVLYKENIIDKEFLLSNNISYKVTNIFASKKGSGKILSKRYGTTYFGISYLASQKKYFEIMPVHFEVDLKINPNGNKNTIKKLFEKYGNISNFEIKQYDKNRNAYVFNAELSSELNLLNTTHDNLVNIYLPIISSCFSILISFCCSFFTSADKDTFLLIISLLSCFAIYGIIANFLYIYSTSTLYFFIFLFSLILLNRKGGVSYVSKYFKRNNSTSEIVQETFYEIKI